MIVRRAIAIGVFLAACTTPPKPVAWPDGPYGAELQRASQSGAIYRGPDTVLFVHATLDTPAFVKARNQRLAQVFEEPADRATERVPELATSEGTLGAVVAVHTPDLAKNDLDQAASTWSLKLKGASGTVSPLEVRRIAYPSPTLKALYPYLERGFVPYRVTFPDDAGAGPWTLVLAGTAGRTELVFAK